MSSSGGRKLRVGDRHSHQHCYYQSVLYSYMHITARPRRGRHPCSASAYLARATCRSTCTRSRSSIRMVYHSSIADEAERAPVHMQVHAWWRPPAFQLECARRSSTQSMHTTRCMHENPYTNASVAVVDLEGRRCPQCCH